jgi:hypothetical protein
MRAWIRAARDIKRRQYAAATRAIITAGNDYGRAARTLARITRRR